MFKSIYAYVYVSRHDIVTNGRVDEKEKKKGWQPPLHFQASVFQPVAVSWASFHLQRGIQPDGSIPHNRFAG